MIPIIFLLCFYWFIIVIDVFFSRNLVGNFLENSPECWMNNRKKVTGVIAALKHKKIYLMFHI